MIPLSAHVRKALSDKTCDTCAYWDKLAEELWNNSKPCMNNKLSNPDIDYLLGAEDMLFYEYNEGGSFYTCPRFGCIHHKPTQKEGESA
jgi:hypothetical protein